ncbi:MAG: outer membrane protein TolC [Clostridiales bacterium]|jgi:outer membrane protein TolC|nr:outer membrane protein TolC [Clostridiales bacterium]
MSKKILGIVLVCMVLLTGVFLPGSRPASAGDDEVLDLTLEKAIAIAMEKNADVNLAKIGVKKAEKGLDEAESAADKSEDSDSPFGPTGYEKALIERVAPRQAQMGLTVAQKTLEATKNGTKLAVENVYYDVLKARTELENAGDAVKRAEERLRLANVSLEAGTAARLDVINAEVVLAQKKVRLNAAENTYKSKVMEFNKTLGLPLSTKINLTSSFEFKPVEIDLEKVIAEAKESDVAYVGAQEALAVAEKQFAEAKKFYTPNVYKYREAQYAYEEAKLNAEKAERDLVMDIKNAYFKLQSARESYEAMQKGVEQAQEAYRLTKLRSEIGMSTQIELQEASDRLDEARAELLSALYNYNLATAQFRYGIFGFSGTSASSSGMMAGGM